MPQLRTADVDGHRIEYRLIGSGADTVVILHGGHMSARCSLGEATFLDLGRSVLLVSRPGYGRTDLSAGPSVPEFIPRLARLITDLGLRPRVAVGISLGARSAMTLAAFHPDLVQRVILVCPVSFRPWPSPRTRRIAQLVFNPVTERLTWGIVHQLLRRDPARNLPKLVKDLSLLPGPEAVERLGSDRKAMVDFLLTCRSSRGFLNRPAPAHRGDRRRTPARPGRGQPVRRIRGCGAPRTSGRDPAERPAGRGRHTHPHLVAGSGRRADPRRDHTVSGRLLTAAVGIPPVRDVDRLDRPVRNLQTVDDPVVTATS